MISRNRTSDNAPLIRKLKRLILRGTGVCVALYTSCCVCATSTAQAALQLGTVTTATASDFDHGFSFTTTQGTSSSDAFESSSSNAWASAHARAGDGNLGVDAQVFSVGHNGATAGARTGAVFAGAFHIWNGALPYADAVSAHGPVVLRFRLDGYLQGDAVPIFDEQSGTTYWALGGYLDIQAQVNSPGVQFKEVLLRGLGSRAGGVSQERIPQFFEAYEFLLSLPVIGQDGPDGRTLFEYGGFLGIDNLNTHAGLWTAFFGNSLKLTSIEFSDGITPEELGFQVEFESGRPSPNISLNSVPEPTSMALFGFGLVIAGLRRRLNVFTRSSVSDPS